MPFVKKVLSWVFAVTSLLYLENLYRIILYVIHRNYGPAVQHALLLASLFNVFVIATSGMAWWNIWKEMSSAKWWAIAASVMHIVIFLRQFVSPSQPVWGRHVGALIIGIIGLIAFLWPAEQMPSGQPSGS